jgi:mRNA interferase MazF
MTSPAPFDVLIVPFPFVDIPVRKRRPALVISHAAFNDATGTAVMAMITSAADSDWHDDQLIDDIDAAGLQSPCKVRMKFFSVPLSLATDPVGRLGDADRQRILHALDRTVVHRD